MILLRYDTSFAGTPGSLILRDWRVFRTIELPWKDNVTNASCIPAGGPYALRVRRPSDSPNFNYKHIAVDGVPGRSEILFHRANWAGDADKGFTCELLGCIAPGLRWQYRRVPSAGDVEQPGVHSSGQALSRIVQAVEHGDAQLWIAWASHVAHLSPSDGPLLVSEETPSSYPPLDANRLA